VGIKAIQYRLRSDFQLAIITLLGLISLLGITPFALLRGINGQWLSFAVDATIEVVILGGVLYAWQAGDTRHPSIFLAYFIGVMSVVAVQVLGIPGAYWMYPALIANFFLTDRRHALAIALLALTGLILGDRVFPSLAETASYSVTLVVSALLAYAFAYRTSLQREQLEVLASKDALTNVSNRRTMLEELERARHAFEREQRTYGLLILDLDHFKQVNDRYGHLAGDQVLVKLARLLEQHVRKNDRLFRYGGEEFVLLAMPADPAGLSAMAEKLRVMVEQSVDDSRGHSITVSIGGAVLRREESIDGWFARADTALYVAKNSGRNRAIVDPDQ
jgi:diguanylate cyclase (GGDEF)-like protein